MAVLGSGVMGSAIACHLAQCGAEVMLLDLPADEGPRDGVAAGHLAKALKSKPSPIYSKRFASRIETGNFDDDLPSIAECDWIIEVIVERLDIKQQLFERVEQHRTPGTFITSNTSGIPIGMLAEGRSEDFRKHFCGTHFFNPPRYLQLLEIIPGPDTLPEVLDFFTAYGERILGKQSVFARTRRPSSPTAWASLPSKPSSTPWKTWASASKPLDKLTGPAMGRPKSATFRTCDVVGIDTLGARGQRRGRQLPQRRAGRGVCHSVVRASILVDQGWLGSKSGQGFYKKVVTDGKKEIHALDLKTLEYKPKQKVQFATLAAAKNVDDLRERTKLLFNGQDQAGEFYRRIFADVFAYVSHRVPEISDEPYRIDDALRAGFGWELGAFESWDAIGLQAGLDACAARGLEVAQWVHDLVASGATTFLRRRPTACAHVGTWPQSHTVIPGQDGRIALSLLGEDKTVWANSGTTIQDLGDGILNIAFHTKMNTIGAEVIEGLNKVIDLAESDPQWRGVVISNEGGNFSAGANVGMIFMLAVEQEWDELDYAIRMFQNTTMRLRYSGIPVVAALHQLTLGGGCEVCLHVDKVVAHAETYIGLGGVWRGRHPGRRWHQGVCASS